MKRIEPKSVVIGVAAGVLLTLSLGAATNGLEVYEGRFKLEPVGDNAFVIDTVTGQVWRGYFPGGANGQSDPHFFKPKITR